MKFDTKVNTAREILKRIKKAGMIGNQLAIEVAATELKQLEKEEAARMAIEK